MEAQCLEQRTLRFHFGNGNAAQQMRAHVVGLGRRRVVHVATDVEVPIVHRAADLLERHSPRVAGNILEAVVGGNDLLECSGLK